MDKDEWAAAAVKGDEDALFRRIDIDKRQLYGIAYSYMRNETDAVEAMQETVCRVWAKRRSLRDPRLFTTWMIRILIRVCMDERKKKRRELVSADSFVQGWSESRAINNLPDMAERIDMEAQIKSLPSKYRMVIVLKYYRDLTITDIAELLEKPDGTVRTWLHKGLTLLKNDLTAIGKGEDHGQGGRKGMGRSASGAAE
ncbi:sigma-70 family RNA polymerase sigma factor [Paenibacillus radicis (ex Gao et al. 2016)]|uniref:RNA polymerase subunit sigma-24 n=1 Tax=Paenibacillus radicis (ex Gao et al. 2016) TaxID=1737354 RepID=A0A917H648_9BACL|nr:sigma-70 family RNA polymerase sigma factor [Paenibacillus radicis (ex Gao et al. 2016)]GGG67814.1 RNA polymerase subunit sigma-24 [Paenibacillus radicis (ex Gao et al. 2016)]